VNRRRPAPWLYLFGVLGWTWGLVGGVAVAGLDPFSLPATLPMVLGLLGPLIVPAVLIARGYGDPEMHPSVSEFLRRSFDPRRLAPRWFLIVLLLVGIVAAGPVLLDPAARGQSLVEVGPGLFLLAGLAAGAVEEPGWRGYAQESLQRRMPVLRASLVIGVFWALWHLPLFFVPGTYQAGLGIGTLDFWAFLMALVAASPLYAWLYDAAGNVTFVVVLYHGLGNVARELVPDAANRLEVGVEAALALFVTLAAARWMLRRRAPAH